MLRRRNEFQEKYDEFLHELKQEIVSGRLQPGEYILPENTLSQKYDLSRVSIRKALAELVEDGLIEKIAGKGNRVKLPDENAVPETLKLGWFSHSYEIDIVRRIIGLFEEKHPFVKVELEVLPEHEYTTALAQAIELGQGPDAFMVSDKHIREWIDLQKTPLLAGYVPEGLHPERDSYPAVFQLFEQDGVPLAAPFIFSPVMICYNRAIFRDIGMDEDEGGGNPVQSWEDLLHIASACTKAPEADGTTEQYGFCFSASPNRWPVFMLQNGGTVMSADRSRSTFSDPATVEAIDFCVQLMYKHQVSPIYSHGSNHLAESLFMKQRVAMILTTYYFMNEFRDHPIEWDVLPLPERKRRATLLLGGGLAVNSHSAKPRLARQLVDYMTGLEAQTLLKQHGCTIPMRKAVAEDDSLLNPLIHPPHYNRFADVMPYAVTLRDLHLTERDVLELQEEMHLLWANMEGAQQACERIEQVLNRKLNS